MRSEVALTSVLWSRKHSASQGDALLAKEEDLSRAASAE
jgi:hypothetical protein